MRQHDLKVQFRFPAKFKAQAVARAKALGMKLAQYVRKLIADDLGIEPPKIDLGRPQLRTKVVDRQPGQQKTDWQRISRFLDQQSAKETKGPKRKKTKR